MVFQFSAVVGTQFVHLGHRDDGRDFLVLEVMKNLELLRLGPPPGVDDEDDGPEGFSGPQVGFDHFLPRRTHGHRDLGVPVTGQVHQVIAVVNQEKIHRAGLAWSGRNFRHALLSDEGIEQR